MESRLDSAVQKQCDAVETDNIDAFQNNSGFILNNNDQLKYNRWLSKEAHKRNLSIALKNDLDQIPDLIDDFDFIINEECFLYDECEKLIPFIKNGKAVLHVEYDLNLEKFCKKSKKMQFNSLKMDKELNGKRNACES